MTKLFTTLLLFSFVSSHAQINVKKTIENIIINYKTKATLTGIGEVRNDIKNGKWTFYYNVEDSSIHSIGKYENGLKIGTWKTYRKKTGPNRIESVQTWNNGHLKQVDFFLDQTDSKKVTECNITGNLSIQSSKKIKDIINYHKVYIMEHLGTGDFHSSNYDLYNFISDVLIKDSVESFSSFWTFENDLGETREIGEKGYEKSIFEYQKYTHKLFNESYYLNDVLTYTKHYDLSVSDVFTITKFHANGTKKSIEIFKKDKLHGTCKYLNKQGKPLEILKYKNGELVKKKTFANKS